MVVDRWCTVREFFSQVDHGDGFHLVRLCAIDGAQHLVIADLTALARLGNICLVYL